MTTKPRIEERRYWVCPTNFVWVGAELVGGGYPFDFPGTCRRREIRFETEDGALLALEAYVARVVEAGEEHVLRLLCYTHNMTDHAVDVAVGRNEFKGVPHHAKVSFEWRLAEMAVVTTQREGGDVDVGAKCQSRYVARWTERAQVTQDGVTYTGEIAHEEVLTEWGEPQDRGYRLEAAERVERIEWWA